MGSRGEGEVKEEKRGIERYEDGGLKWWESI
jgi:hypothetical protein